MKKALWVLVALTLILGVFPLASQAAPLKNFSWRAEYYNNSSLSGAPVDVRFEDSLSHDWGTGSPGPGIPSDHFSARWTVSRQFEAGTYLFLLSVDDGARVWLNGKLILDSWNVGQKRNLKTEIYFETDGLQELQVAYFEKTGQAFIKLEWLKVGGKDDIAGAWTGEYFTNRFLEGEPVLVRQEGEINYDWDSGSPDPRVTRDNFSVRWTRSIYLGTGYYKLAIQHDDGMRIFINGKNIYNSWYDQGVSYRTRRIFLKEGLYEFKVEYYDHLGNAIARMQIDGDPGHLSQNFNRYHHVPAGEVIIVDHAFDSDPGDIIIADDSFGPPPDQVEVILLKCDSPNFYWGGQPGNRYMARGGYDSGSFYWTYNSRAIPVDYGEWRPNLKAGQYEVFVYIPQFYATTGKAYYQIHHSGGKTDRFINQGSYQNEWVSLGAYYFDGSSSELVRLYDSTGEVYASTSIAFDAIKFVRREF